MTDRASMGTAIITRRTADLERVERDLRALTERLNDGGRRWQQISFSFTPSVVCSECGGRGEIQAGIFGASECWECQGARMVPDPRPNALELLSPDFTRPSQFLDAARDLAEQNRAWLRLAERAVYDGTALPPDPAALPSGVEIVAISDAIATEEKKLATCLKQASGGQRDHDPLLTKGSLGSLGSGEDDE